MASSRAVRYQGRITEWRDEQGYGFIVSNGGGERVFLHAMALGPRAPRPVGGEAVYFVVVRDDRGRLRAEQVEYVVRARRPIPRRTVGARSIRSLLAGTFLIGAGVLAAMQKIPGLAFAIYFGLSVLTFGFYAADKAAAMAGRWRVAEGTLQGLALLGGWPGGLLAQEFLHHKSRKQSFQTTFWMVVVLNLLASGWLCSTAGTVFLASLRG